MANTIKLKRSAVPNKAPTTSDLSLGELGLNTYHGRLYTKKNDGTESIVEIGAAGGSAALNDLTDVTIASATSGQVLKFDGSSWGNAADSTFSGAYADLTGKPTLATVATSGSYTDLTNKPTIPSALDDLSDVVITSAAKGQFVVHNGTSFVNARTIEADTAATKPLIVKGAASQTANLLEAQNSAGTALCAIASTGAVTQAVNGNTLGSLTVTTTAAATKALIVKGAASQTANLLEAQNSAASTLFAVNSAGALTVSSDCFVGRPTLGTNSFAAGKSALTSQTAAGGENVAVGIFAAWALTAGYKCTAVGYNANVGNSAGGAPFAWANTSIGWQSGGALTLGYENTCVGAAAGDLMTGSRNVIMGYYAGVTSGAPAVGRVTVLGYGAKATGDSALAIGDSASAGANAMDIRFGGASRITGNSSGQIGINVASAAAQLQVNAGAAATKGLILKAAASQTANLLEAQDSAGTALCAIASTGAVTQTVNGNTLGSLTVTTTAAATKALIVKGAASQSVNLFEVQKSDGTIFTAVNAVGSMGIGADTSASSRLFVKGESADNLRYALAVADSDSTDLLLVRCDGRIVTGTKTLSPYNNTTASAANVFVSSGGEIQRSTSSLKYKTDVRDATHGLAEVLQLRPVTYLGKNDGNTVFGGLIAEEVHAIGLTEFVQYSEDGTPDALAYGNMASLAFKAIKELNAKIEALEARIASLESV